jgi:RNA polymerase-binding transcription factor DksA
VSATSGCGPGRPAPCPALLLPGEGVGADPGTRRALHSGAGEGPNGMTATSTASSSASRDRPVAERPGQPRGGAGLFEAGDSWTGYVESARARLVEQRAFRLAQLEELTDLASDGLAAAGPEEVRGALRAAARAALSDVDSALRRIEQGTYGRCPGCGGAMSLARLDAIPSAPLCGACHRAVETGRRRGLPPSPARANPSDRARISRRSPRVTRRDGRGSGR